MEVGESGIGEGDWEAQTSSFKIQESVDEYSH